MEGIAIVYHYLPINKFPRQMTVSTSGCEEVNSPINNPILFDFHNPISLTAATSQQQFKVLQYSVIFTLLCQRCENSIASSGQFASMTCLKCAMLQKQFCLMNERENTPAHIEEF